MAFKRGALMAKVEASTLKKEEDRKQIAAFKVGDTIDVHQWILEGFDKEGNESIVAAYGLAPRRYQAIETY